MTIPSQATRGKGRSSIRSFKAKVFSALALIFLLIANGFPAGSTPIIAKSLPGHAKSIQAATTLTFISEADARVEEHSPDTNSGASNYLEVISANNRSIESYVRFTVSGVSGAVQTARLRVY